MKALGYWRWRGGLAVGKAVKSLGGRLLDLGWGLQDHAAQHWWRPAYTRKDAAP